MLLHPAHYDGMAEFRRQLEDLERRAIEQAYLLELCFGRPLARLHQAWLDEERAIAEERARPIGWAP